MGSRLAVITLVAFGVIVAILWLRHITRSDKASPNLYLTLSGDQIRPQSLITSITDLLAKQTRDYIIASTHEETGELFEASFPDAVRNMAHIETCRDP